MTSCYFPLSTKPECELPVVEHSRQNVSNAKLLVLFHAGPGFIVRSRRRDPRELRGQPHRPPRLTSPIHKLKEVCEPAASLGLLLDSVGVFTDASFQFEPYAKQNKAYKDRVFAAEFPIPYGWSTPETRANPAGVEW